MDDTYRSNTFEPPASTTNPIEVFTTKWGCADKFVAIWGSHLKLGWKSFQWMTASFYARKDFIEPALEVSGMLHKVMNTICFSCLRPNEWPLIPVRILACYWSSNLSTFISIWLREVFCGGRKARTSFIPSPPIFRYSSIIIKPHRMGSWRFLFPIWINYLRKPRVRATTFSKHHIYALKGSCLCKTTNLSKSVWNVRLSVQLTTFYFNPSQK